MQKIKGPGIFLAQFLRDEAPFDNLKNISQWAANLGFKGVQIPTWDARVINLDLAATSQTYCDDLTGTLQETGLEVSELAAHLQGQMLVVHPAYAVGFQGFHPGGQSDAERTAWAEDQLKKTILASEKMKLKSVPVLSGGLLWHTVYPWPQRPAGLVETGFQELVKRWLPVLNLAADKGISIAYELHPGSDLFDGATFEMFLEATKAHPAVGLNYDPSHFVLQQLDYLHFIQLYGDRISAFHVKDAEFNPSGRVGVYGGYQSWINRAGRFRSLGDGQVNFRRIFSLLTEVGYSGWAVLEWECCLKSPEQGAREAAPFIQQHLIDVTEVAFDDFAGGAADLETNRIILGLS